MQVFLLPKLIIREENAYEKKKLFMNYITIPYSVLENTKLNSTDKLLMGIINSLAHNENYCYANNEYLSKKLNVSKRTISKSLSKLKSEKFVRVETMNNGRRIYLTDLVWNNTSIGIDKNFYTP